MNNRVKVAILWGVFLFGMIFHTLLAIMPVFWGQSVAMTQEQIVANPMVLMMWMVLFFYMLPMIAIVLSLLIEAKWYRTINFVLSLLFTFMNVFHIVEHASEAAVDMRQVVLLIVVLISGVFLNIASFKWTREQKK